MNEQSIPITPREDERALYVKKTIQGYLHKLQDIQAHGEIILE